MRNNTAISDCSRMKVRVPSMATRLLFLGVGILIGATLSFLLGTVFVPDQSGTKVRSPRGGQASGPGVTPVGRQVFSPSIKNDPFVISEWSKTVDSLERQCKQYGKYCAEAKKARAAVDDMSHP